MHIWEFVRNKLKDDKKIVLMLVVESKGSSPGRKGFKMAVSEDGSLFGSIGGGKTEFEMVELAKTQFNKPKGVFLKRQIHNKSKNDDATGMLCSGTQWVAFYFLDRTYLSLSESIAKARSGILTFDNDGILYNRELSSEKQYKSSIVNKEQWSFTERLGYNDFIYIFGGGHTSVELSMIFRRLGFYVSVFDDRNKHLSSYKQNIYANSKKIINYKKSSKYIPEGDSSYIVIMTFGHKSDQKILSQFLGKKFNYIGMMGSKAKVAAIFKKLIEKGYSKEDLDFVDSPIGISIGSQTPTEIAISIAAKIIEVKGSKSF